METDHGVCNLLLQSVCFPQQNSIILHHRWECFLLCCHCCSFVLILWLACASVHLLNTGDACSWLPPPILVWGNTITNSSGLLALYFLFHIQFSQFSWGWSFWFHILCFLNGKVLQLFFCFRQKHFVFTQKILHSFLSFSSRGASVGQTGGV